MTLGKPTRAIFLTMAAFAALSPFSADAAENSRDLANALALDAPVKPAPPGALPEGKGPAIQSPALTVVGRYRVAAAPPSSLTQREHEIAELVAGGLSNKAIAAELSISHTTAARHVANIMNKLGFNSRSQIAAWVADRAQGPGRAEGPGEPG